MKNKMRIGIDLDEVVAEFVKGFLQIYNAKYKKDLLFESWHSYNFWEVTGMTKAEMFQLADEFYSSKIFDDMNLIEGAKEAINTLSKKHELFIITSRPLHVKDKTDSFVKKHFPNNFSRIIHTGDLFNGQGRTKAEICKELGISFLIEDNKDYSLECAEKGIKVLLFDKPWNQNAGVHENIKRVYSWNEILNEITKGEK